MFAETMFSARKPAWGGMGVTVKEAPTSAEAIKLAGLDWTVRQEKAYMADGTEIPDCFVNIRSSDNKPLGIVGKKYKIVQNPEAFIFTDALLGEGVRYETAGSLKGGKVIWLLAKLPDKYKILGEPVDPYVVFTNTHDGSGSVRVAATPIRVYCSNTLNLSLRTAKRVWSARHTGSVTNKLDEAMETLELADKYMKATQNVFEDLYKVKLDDNKMRKLLSDLIPLDPHMSSKAETNAKTVRFDIMTRYFEAPDLKPLEQTGARFIQAVADTVDHMEPLRRTSNYEENHFKKTLEGNELLDKAVEIVLAA